MSAETLNLQVGLHRDSFALEVTALLDLNEVTAIFGPSGSGKTTLLRAIAGFERPERGRITWGDSLWFDSRDKVMVAPHRRGVGFLFQDARLFAHLDVAGNLRFAQRRQRAAAVAATGSSAPAFGIADVVDALDLGPLLNRRTTTLSGGERRRVALGRTLLANPRLLLLDEPLTGLDRERKAEILPYLEAVPRQFGLPTLLVSHDIDEVARLAARMLVLADGRVALHGSTPDIVERLDLQPFTGRFEAGVVLAGQVARHDSRLHLTYVSLAGDQITLPELSHLSPGDPVRLRVRARDVAIAITRPVGLSIRNVLPGTLTSIVELPSSGFAEALVQLKGGRIRARLTHAAVEDLALEPGMPVFALVKTMSFEGAG